MYNGFFLLHSVDLYTLYIKSIAFIRDTRGVLLAISIILNSYDRVVPMVNQSTQETLRVPIM